MEIAVKVLQLVMALSLLVIVHEFGHFIFAKIFKCRVEKFYLFFNPWFSIFKFKYKDTEYGLGWLPLGGFVKIAGMVDESMDKDQLAAPAKPWEYRAKPAWQRFFIIIGGVMMNLVLALVIYISMSMAWGSTYIDNADVVDGYAYSEMARNFGFENGDKIVKVGDKSDLTYNEINQAILFDSKDGGIEIERLVDGQSQRSTIYISDEQLGEMIRSNQPIAQLRIPFVVDMVSDGSAAQVAGVMAGDSLVAIDDVQMKYTDQFKSVLAKTQKGDTINLYVARGELNEVVELPLVMQNNDGLIGVGLAANFGMYPVQTKTYTFFEAIPQGWNMAVTQIDNYLKQLRMIFSPKTEAYKEVGGIITMGKIFPSQWNWAIFWNLTALLSIMLAVLNILPIPALDGGHLVFIIYEMITRRAPSQKFMEYAQYVGFILLIGLMVFANGNDIIKLFVK